jgi:myo-inositol-1(or 4)-monophosphatase
LDWVGRFSTRLKGPRDLVTEADVATQEAISQVVARHFPDHGFVGEEQSPADAAASRGGEYRWIVDPIDGTTNYVHGVPHYAVSIGVERDAQLVAACVFDPMLKECYTASTGGGAFLNGQPIQASGVENLNEALIAASFPPRVSPELPVISEFLEFLQACQAVRRSGSAALNLAYIAAGRFDGYWAADLHPWDAAAGVLLVLEAGGTVTNLVGGPFDVWDPKCLATGSPALHKEMLAVLARRRRAEK